MGEGEGGRGSRKRRRIWRPPRRKACTGAKGEGHYWILSIPGVIKIRSEPRPPLLPPFLRGQHVRRRILKSRYCGKGAEKELYFFFFFFLFLVLVSKQSKFRKFLNLLNLFIISMKDFEMYLLFIVWCVNIKIFYNEGYGTYWLIQESYYYQKQQIHIYSV